MLLTVIVGVGSVVPTAVAQELSRRTIDVALRHIVEHHTGGGRVALATDNFPDTAVARDVGLGLGLAVGRDSEVLRCTNDPVKSCRIPDADKVIRVHRVRLAPDSVLMEVSISQEFELSEGKVGLSGQRRQILLVRLLGEWQIASDELLFRG